MILLHFICYFFNLDLFECFEKTAVKNEIKNEMKTQPEDSEIDENIESLSKSLDELKEII